MSAFRTAMSIESRPARDRGFVLIAGLLTLVVVSLLGVAMMRGIGLQDRIAANTRDKLRAFSVAQSTLQYGEWWLRQGNGGTGVECSGATTADGLQVCASRLAEPATLPWPTRADYQPAELSVSAGGGLDAKSHLNYHAAPGLHISYLGFSKDGSAQLYEVSAFAFGGRSDTAAAVRSTYQVTSSGIKDLGGL